MKKTNVPMIGLVATALALPLVPVLADGGTVPTVRLGTTADATAALDVQPRSTYVMTAEDDSDLPPEHTVGEVRYRSGGIGESEVRAMKAAGAHYPLALTFTAQQDGRAAFVSDARVSIRRANGGPVLDAQSDGPYMDVALPDGDYQVTAVLHDVAITRPVKVVAGRHAAATFEWRPGQASPPPARAARPSQEGAAPEIPAEMVEAAAAAEAGPSPVSQSLPSQPQSYYVMTADDSALPPEHVLGDVRYRTGGIGEGQTQAMRAIRQDYPLDLTFASLQDGRGVFVSDVQVTIQHEGGGPVLTANADGPYMYVALPDGRYQVTATLHGVPVTRDVTVTNGRHAATSFEWRSDGRAPATLTAAAGGTGAPTAVYSSASGSTYVPLPEQDPLPPEHAVGDVRYRSGGIGASEIEALQAVRGSYPLALTFASVQNGRGVFVSDVKVHIQRVGGGDVFEGASKGPYMLLSLPDGDYQVTALLDGVPVTRDITVSSGRHADAAFRWKSDQVADSSGR